MAKPTDHQSCCRALSIVFVRLSQTLSDHFVQDGFIRSLDDFVEVLKGKICAGEILLVFCQGRAKGLFELSL